MLKNREGRNETINTDTKAQSQIEYICVHFVYCYYKEGIKEKTKALSTSGEFKSNKTF